MTKRTPTPPASPAGDPTTGYQNDAQRVYGHRAFELTEEASDAQSTDAAVAAPAVKPKGTEV